MTEYNLFYLYTSIDSRAHTKRARQNRDAPGENSKQILFSRIVTHERDDALSSSNRGQHNGRVQFFCLTMYKYTNKGVLFIFKGQAQLDELFIIHRNNDRMEKYLD